MTLKAMLAALAISSVTLAAHADIRTFTFSGKVRESLPTALAGTPVTGTFSYDTDAVPYFEDPYDPENPGKGESVYLGTPQSFRIQVNGHTFATENTLVSVMNNFGGNFEDWIYIGGERLTMDGTFFEEGSMSIAFYSGPGKTHVLRNRKLPRTIHINRFDAQRSGGAQVNGSSTGTVLVFDIDHLTVARRPHDDDE